MSCLLGAYRIDEISCESLPNTTTTSDRPWPGQAKREARRATDLSLLEDVLTHIFRLIKARRHIGPAVDICAQESLLLPQFKLSTSLVHDEAAT